MSKIALTQLKKLARWRGSNCVSYPGPTKRALKKSHLPAPDRSPLSHDSSLFPIGLPAQAPLDLSLLRPPSPPRLRRPTPAALSLRPSKVAPLPLHQSSPSVVRGGGASTREVARGVSLFVPSLSHGHIIDLACSSGNSDLEK